MQEYDLVGVALEIANETVAIIRGDGGDSYLRSLFTELIEVERGLAPAAGELDAIVAEIEQNPEEDYYFLCDAKSRLPLFGERVYNPADQHATELLERGLEWIPAAIVAAEAKDREDAKQRAANAEREAARTRLNSEEQAAVIAYAVANRAQWKKRLRKELEDGTAPALLAYIMGHANLGEKWLTAFKMPRNFNHRKATV